MGTPFTRVNGKGNDNVDITKLIVKQDISKISTKSTTMINLLRYKFNFIYYVHYP